MIGGLLKSSSKLALMAAAGILVGGVSMGSAKAADLGGDCCADLEERVAELEATTARKGNRKVSLTVSGQVTRGILYYNDKLTGTSAAIPGVENHVASTRFQFAGSAKVTSSLVAGFEFLVEMPAGARTSTVNQVSVDGGTSGDGTLAVRTANWWLEDKVLGRITVGRLNLGGGVGTIDLGGISLAAPYAPVLIGGGFRYNAAGATQSQLNPNVVGANRGEGIRYDSASFAGLTFQATWAEGDVFTAGARYAAEFGGVRIATGFGWQHSDSRGIRTDGGLDSAAPQPRDEYSGGLSLMHVSSGLFAQGHYAWSDYSTTACSSGGAACVNSAQNFTGRQWVVQGGIAKNWFGPGATALYGEGGSADKYSMAQSATVSDSNLSFWGLGINQKLDAAAMELHLSYRRFDAEVTSTSANFAGANTLDLVYAGARIQF